MRTIRGHRSEALILEAPCVGEMGLSSTTPADGGLSSKSPLVEENSLEFLVCTVDKGKPQHITTLHALGNSLVLSLFMLEGTSHFH